MLTKLIPSLIKDKAEKRITVRIPIKERRAPKTPVPPKSKREFDHLPIPPMVMLPELIKTGLVVPISTNATKNYRRQSRLVQSRRKM